MAGVLGDLGGGAQVSGRLSEVGEGAQMPGRVLGILARVLKCLGGLGYLGSGSKAQAREMVGSGVW